MAQIEALDDRARAKIEAPVDRTADAVLAQLMAWDRGAAPRAVWDRDEYEFWASVAPSQKDALLLALIAECGGQGDAVDRLRDWLTAHGIPHEFHNWM